jgi:hypothetical protein
MRNNSEKFPDGYVIGVSKSEFEILRSKNLIANASKTRVLPTAFTERGLYMLATILKGPRATQTALAITVYILSLYGNDLIYCSM